MQTDETFRIPIFRYVEQRVAFGAPVCLYNFSWSSLRFGGGLGAEHVVDVPFSFNTLTAKEAAPILGGLGEQPLAVEMHSCWTRFIKTGAAGWPRHDLEARPTMRFEHHFRYGC
jgi:para-nitrobenzyl esterase